MNDEWNKLYQECMNCSGCGLCQGRHSVVFGVGNVHADIMFVGEGPGEQEDLRGEPFVGPAGQLLDDMLRIIDIDRSNCYIANIVKCRPPGNRDPREEEQEACIPFLRRQFSLIRPKIVVCLGRIAASRLINSGFRITREHGNWTYNKGVWFTALYHPSFLLRDPGKRPEAFQDLLSIRVKIQELGIMLDSENTG